MTPDAPAPSGTQIHSQMASTLEKIVGVVPDLRQCMLPHPLTTRPQEYKLSGGYIVLVLYAGKYDHNALETYIQQEAPWMSNYVLALDISRDRNLHDLLDNQLYSHLAHAASEGRLLAIIGGPPCRTWSICLHKPQHDGTPGRPLRDRHYPYVWGRKHLTADEQDKADNDSALLLRQLALYEISCKANPDTIFLLEHPMDPEQCSTDPNASNCCTIWDTQTLKNYTKRHNMVTTSFSQCQLGSPYWKDTTILTKGITSLRKWDGYYCDHDWHDHPHNTNDLARWAPDIMEAIARDLARQLPWLRHYRQGQLPDRPTDTASEAAPATTSATIRIGHKQRPIRDGGGKPSPGRLRQNQRKTTPLKHLGAALIAYAKGSGAMRHQTAMDGDATECPYDADYLEPDTPNHQQTHIRRHHHWLQTTIQTAHAERPGKGRRTTRTTTTQPLSSMESHWESTNPLLQAPHVVADEGRNARRLRLVGRATTGTYSNRQLPVGVRT